MTYIPTPVYPAPGSAGPGWANKLNTDLDDIDVRVEDSVSKSDDDVKQGDLVFKDRVIVKGDPWIDFRNPDFAGGAELDRTTDDTAAIEAALASVGVPGQFRAARVYMPGIARITRKLRVDVSLSIECPGWGSPSAPNLGGGFFYDGPAGQNALEIYRAWGCKFENVMVLAADSAVKPAALIAYFGDTAPNVTGAHNGFSTFIMPWIGLFPGLGSGKVAAAGFQTQGPDATNDQTIWIGPLFQGCDVAVDLVGIQALLHRFYQPRFYTNGTHVRTKAQVALDSPYFAEAADWDIDADTGAVVTIHEGHSELSGGLAKLRGGAELDASLRAFQITSSLNPSGVLIDAIDDISGAAIRLKQTEFTYIGYPDGGSDPGHVPGVRPVAKIRLHQSTAGVITRRHLVLDRVRGLRETNFDVAPVGGADVIIASGSVQLPDDGNGRQAHKYFFNTLKAGNTALSFDRDERSSGRVVATRTQSLAYGALASLAATGVTLAYAEALAGDAILAVPPTNWPAALLFSTYVSAAGFYTHRVFNSDGATVTPPTGTWKFILVRPWA